MSGLKQLLIDLAEQPDLQKAYKTDPEAVMRRYQLNEEAIKAMLAKDVETIKRLSGLDNLRSNGTIQAYDYR